MPLRVHFSAEVWPLFFQVLVHAYDKLLMPSEAFSPLFPLLSSLIARLSVALKSVLQLFLCGINHQSCIFARQGPIALHWFNSGGQLLLSDHCLSSITSQWVFNSLGEWDPCSFWTPPHFVVWLFFATYGLGLIFELSYDLLVWNAWSEHCFQSKMQGVISTPSPGFLTRLYSSAPPPALAEFQLCALTSIAASWSSWPP